MSRSLASAKTVLLLGCSLFSLLLTEDARADALSDSRARGRVLFTQETFGGNGRTCATCHVLEPGFTGGLPPDDIQARFATLSDTFDPLFIAESNMNLNTLTILGGATFASGAILHGPGGAKAKVLAWNNPTVSSVLLVYGGISPMLKAGDIITDGTLYGTVVSIVPGSLDQLEAPTRMRTSTVFSEGRGLILENIDGFGPDAPAAMFRKSPHIQNLRLTAPYGFSSGIADLGEFSETAIIQHFTRTIARVPGVDFRLPTAQEKADLKAFMESPEHDSVPGPDDTKFSLGHFARTTAQRRGREVFFSGSAQCSFCHSNKVLGDDSRNSFHIHGASNLPINGPIADDLPGELFVFDEKMFPRSFDTPGLFNVKNNTPLFHDASTATVEDAVRFYTGREFARAEPGISITMSEQDIQDVTAFLNSLVARSYTVTEGAVDVTREGTRVHMGRVKVGVTSSRRSLTIRNTSTRVVRFGTQACALVGPGAANYAFDCNTLNGRSLAANSSTVISVTFKPLSPGRKEALLELSTDEPTGVDLTGDGFIFLNETFSVSSSGTPPGFTEHKGGAFSVSNGQLRLATCTTCTGLLGNVLINNLELPESYTVSIDAMATSTSAPFNDFAVILGFKDMNNFYFVAFNEKDTLSNGTNDPTTNGIFRVANGVRTELLDFSGTTLPGDGAAALHKIRIERIRSTIRVFRGATLMGLVTDPSLVGAGGKAGVGSFNDSARFDNFVVVSHALSADFSTDFQSFSNTFGNFLVVNGTLQFVDPLPQEVSRHNDVVEGDFELFADATATESNNDSLIDNFSVVFNFQNESNFMFANFSERNDPSISGIFKMVNGVAQEIGGFGTSLTPAGSVSRIRIQKIGSTVKVFKNGTQIGPTVTDTTFKAGRIGVGTLLMRRAVFDNVFVELR